MAKALADDILKRLDKAVEEGNEQKALEYVDTVMSELIGASIKSSMGVISKEQFQSDLFKNKDKIIGALIHSIKPEYRTLYLVVLQLIDDVGQGNFTNIKKFIGGDVP